MPPTSLWTAIGAHPGTAALWAAVFLAVGIVVGNALAEAFTDAHLRDLRRLRGRARHYLELSRAFALPNTDLGDAAEALEDEL